MRGNGSTYEFEVSLYTLQDKPTVTLWRAQLVPLFLVRDIVRVAVAVDPVHARGFGVFVVDYVVYVTYFVAYRLARGNSRRLQETEMWDVSWTEVSQGFGRLDVPFVGKWLSKIRG